MSLITKIKTRLIFHLLKKDIHSEFAQFLISSLMKKMFLRITKQTMSISIMLHYIFLRYVNKNKNKVTMILLSI